MNDASELVESTGDAEVFPRWWSTSDRLRSLSTMADWFRIMCVHIPPSRRIHHDQ